LLAFRRQLLRLLPKLTNLKCDKFEFQFAKEVADVAKQAQASLPPISEKSSLAAAREKLIKLAMTSPEVAIIEAWRYLETELLELIVRQNIDVALPYERCPEFSALCFIRRDS
jgi:hypothetical protein